MGQKPLIYSIFQYGINISGEEISASIFLGANPTQSAQTHWNNSPVKAEKIFSVFDHFVGFALIQDLMIPL